MTKFEANAICKQDEAYKEGYAIKAFDYSCDLCATRNLRGGSTCARCPIKEAHIRALTEIRSGLRNVYPSKNISRYSDQKGHITIVINM